jgi:hypothetical protein
MGDVSPMVIGAGRVEPNEVPHSARDNDTDTDLFINRMLDDRTAGVTSLANSRHINVELEHSARVCLNVCVHTRSNSIIGYRYLWTSC